MVRGPLSPTRAQLIEAPRGTVRLRPIRRAMRSDSIASRPNWFQSRAQHEPDSIEARFANVTLRPIRHAMRSDSIVLRWIYLNLMWKRWIQFPPPPSPLHETTESRSRRTNVVRHRESSTRSRLFPPPHSSSRDHRVQLEEHKRCAAPKLKLFGPRHLYGCRKAVRGGAKG